MATIRKRGNTYQIRVSCGYDTSGNQVVQTMTWKPAEGMTPKQAEKELQKQAILFEDKCMKGQVTANVKFQDFAKTWYKEYAEIRLKTQTIRNYHTCDERVYKAIGHLRMDKINTRTIQMFVTELSKAKRFTKKGKEMPPLSPKTIKNYITFISTVFEYAIKMQMLSHNPCRNVVLPTMKKKEREVYTLEEVQKMLELFENESEEHYKYTIFFTLAAFTGLRRGELLGLEWKDIDWDDQLINVVRTSAYTKEKGTYTDTPKTKSSVRMIKIPPELIQKLKEFKAWQDDYKEKVGSKWIECDRLFTNDFGSPMSTQLPHKYFHYFCKRTGMRFVNVHSFRHFNASILISSGVDVRTVQSCLGHSCATTTLTVYAHSFKEAQAKAMDCVASCILKHNEDDRISDSAVKDK